MCTDSSELKHFLLEGGGGMEKGGGWREKRGGKMEEGTGILITPRN